LYYSASRAPATTAMAPMLSRLVYRMLNFGHDYVDREVEFYEAKYQQLQRIRKQAAALHTQLIPLIHTLT